MVKRKKYIFIALAIVSLTLNFSIISPTITQVHASSTSNGTTYKEAQKAVKKALKSKALTDIYTAKIKVESLPDSSDKDDLLLKINKLAEADIDELIEDATLIIQDLEVVYSSNDIQDAKNYLIRANDVLYRFDEEDDEEEIKKYTKKIKKLNKRINNISEKYNSLISEASELTNIAISRKTELSKNEAQKIINKLEIDSDIRSELQEKIDCIDIEDIPNTIIRNSGWTKTDDKWYYVNNYGVNEIGWINDHGNWYYLNNDGVMQTGWIMHEGDWYYLNNSGAMVTGWLYSNNHWYYLKQNGIMAVNTTIDGYKINSFGILDS